MPTMKRFTGHKKSPVASKKILDGRTPLEIIDDGASDFTDSEPGIPNDMADIIDGLRSATPDPTKTREALDTVRHKIDRIRMEIQKEQVSKEEHVKEYLDLSSKAANDENKARNIKIVFEKQNSASAQTIAKLQKKLERYETERKKIEQYGASSHRAAKEVLKDVGQGIKEFGGSVVGNIRTAINTDGLAKPKEHMSTKSKSGSVDNINSLARGEGHSIFYTGFLDNASVTDQEQHMTGRGSPASPTGSTTLPANFKLSPPPGSENGVGLGVELGSVSDEASFHVARDSPHNSSTSPEFGHHTPALFDHSAIEPLLQKLNSNADSIERVGREMELIRSQFGDLNEEMISMRTYIEEERLADKYERLEEHLNDFVELTQNEMTNLKQEISNMEEKIDYQLEERTRDLQEALENANTRITKLELQNQHQQLISMEGVDNPNTKMLLTKCINVLLAFLAVVLVFVSTISNVIGPLLNARWKFISMIILVFALILTSRYWTTITQAMDDAILSRDKQDDNGVR